MKNLQKVLLLLVGLVALSQTAPWVYNETNLENVDSEPEEIVFVFTMVRHGARGTYDAGFAPFDGPRAYFYNQGKEHLTPSGMKQRYLFGRENRARYTGAEGGFGFPSKYRLMAPHYVRDQLWIESTSIPRTLQSAYSELAGLYPLNFGKGMDDDELNAIYNIAIPALDITDYDAINSGLGNTPVGKGF